MSNRRAITDVFNSAKAAVQNTLQSAGGEGIAEGGKFLSRVDQLLKRWDRDEMDTQSLLRALDSEKEALAYNLAALANEKRKQFLASLFHATLDMIRAILAGV